MLRYSDVIRCKMADSDVLFRQCAIVEFLVKEEIPAAEIHCTLQCAYENVSMDTSSVGRWVKQLKDGNTSIILIVVASTEHYEKEFDITDMKF